MSVVVNINIAYGTPAAGANARRAKPRGPATPREPLPQEESDEAAKRPEQREQRTLGRRHQKMRKLAKLDQRAGAFDKVVKQLHDLSATAGSKELSPTRQKDLEEELEQLAEELGTLVSEDGEESGFLRVIVDGGKRPTEPATIRPSEDLLEKSRGLRDRIRAAEDDLVAFDGDEPILLDAEAAFALADGLKAVLAGGKGVEAQAAQLSPLARELIR